jgi:type II secretory pathway predicted ATPase ExeA
MKGHIRVGGLSSDAYMEYDVALPVQEDTQSMKWISDTLDQAVAERRGVVVYGPKGTGKSVALERVVDEFENGERAAEQQDARRSRRTVVVVEATASTTEVDVISRIHKAFTGNRLQRHERGRRLEEDELMDRLVALLLQSNVAALAVDEAERLSDTGLRVLRDLMSLAERRDKERRSGGELRAAGVGVLLVGTGSLAERVRATDEAGERWVRLKAIPPLDAAEVADMYLAFLPGLQAHVDEVGTDEWAEYVRIHVSQSQHVSFRRIENHVRNYIRRMRRNDETITDRTEVGWDEGIFTYTLEELRNASRQPEPPKGRK